MNVKRGHGLVRPRSRPSPLTAMCPAEQAGGRLLGQPISFVPDPKRLRLAERLALSKPTFPELLFGALGVAGVSGGFLVCPILLPRFAEAASGGFARLKSPLGELGFHRCPE